MSASRQPGYPDSVSLPMSRATPEMLGRLVEAVRGQVIEGVRIHDARASTQIDWDGVPIVRLYVLVDDPPPGEPTWPVDAILAIMGFAGRQAWQQIGIPDEVWTSPVSVREAEVHGFSPAAPGG
jgi:hypothetical protein